MKFLVLMETTSNLKHHQYFHISLLKHLETTETRPLQPVTTQLVWKPKYLIMELAHGSNKRIIPSHTRNRMYYNLYRIVV